MLHVFLLMLISASQAWDIRTIPCHKGKHNWPYVMGEWDCWYNQTCGKNHYECNGVANDAPPFPPLEFNFIIIGLVGTLSILVFLLVCCCSLKRRVKYCC